MLAYFSQVITIAGDDTSHEIMVTAQVLRRAIVYDVRTMLQRSLQVRAHHGVVYHDNGVRRARLDVLRDLAEIRDLEQRVRWALEKNHGSLAGDDVLVHVFGIGGINVVDDHASVRLDVREQPVRAAVQIIARDNFVSGLEQAQNDVQRRHARRDGERMLRGRDFRKMVL